MIRLLVADIDGCLAMPYQPFRLDRLGKLAAYARAAGLPASNPGLPSVSICSGRSYPYVEAMSQLVAIDTPVLFESGAGMFDPLKAELVWHPAFTDSVRQEIDAIRLYMEDVAARGVGLTIDYAKRSQAALVCNTGGSLYVALEEVERFVHKNHTGFNVFHTHISIDVVPDGLTKAEGMHWLAHVCGIKVSEMAFIGDSNGDIGAMQTVGRSFSPANGSHDARQTAGHASRLNDIDAVLEAYDLIKEGS